jgi:ribosome-binding protein aMBF1 (putative translation factor)
MDDIGQRIRAARGYTGISRETLLEDVDLTPAQLERIEVGLDEPDELLEPRLVGELAKATRLPASFFTGDFDSLD